MHSLTSLHLDVHTHFYIPLPIKGYLAASAIDYKPQGGFISILRLEVCVICFSVQDFNMYCLKSEPHR